MKRVSSMSWLTSMSIMILLVFLIAFLVTVFHSSKIENIVSQQSKVLVELERESQEADVDGIQNFIQDYKGYVSNTVELYDEQAAMEMMQDELADLTYELDVNPFAKVISFSVQPEFQNSSSQKILKDELLKLPGVNHVSIQDVDYAQIKGNINKFKFLLLTFFGLFALSTILLLYNVMKISLVNDEKKIKTMSLVGADEKFIMTPYLKKSFMLGVSGFVGSLVVTAMFWYSTSFIFDSISNILQPGYVILTLLIVLIIALMLPMISTYMIIRLYLRKL